MIAEFIVMFRESLEVAFVAGIMLAYLHKTRNSEHEKHVWLGISAGIAASIVLAYAFQFMQGGFEANEELFEGIFMVVTAALVSWLVLWIAKQKEVAASIQKDVKIKLDKKETFGLFILALTATLREGIEAVLFMAGIFVNTGGVSLFGGLLGIVAAVITGILVFEYAVKFNISLFFKATTVILVLLAAGLFSQGLHELQEANVLPIIFAEHVYELPFAKADLMGEKGAIGGILKGLVGYDTNPSDLQVLGYGAYLALVYALYKRA